MIHLLINLHVYNLLYKFIYQIQYEKNIRLINNDVWVNWEIIRKETYIFVCGVITYKFVNVKCCKSNQNTTKCFHYNYN